MVWTATDIINIISLVVLIAVWLYGRRSGRKWDAAIKDIRKQLDQGKNT